MGCGTNAVHVTGEQNAEGLIKVSASQQKTRTFTVFQEKNLCAVVQPYLY